MCARGERQISYSDNVVCHGNGQVCMGEILQRRESELLERQMNQGEVRERYKKRL